MTVIAMMIAGGAGALSRYLVDILVSGRLGRAFPWGTLTINVSGSLLLGFLTGLGLYHGLGSDVETIVGSGFCGGFTTFSTFTIDTVGLREAGSTPRAFANVGANLVLATAAAGLGVALASI